MSAKELETALAELRAARDAVDGEAEERLEILIGKVERAVDDGRNLDHGALARITRTIDEVAENADDDAVAKLADAKEAVSTYREGVPGA